MRTVWGATVAGSLALAATLAVAQGPRGGGPGGGGTPATVDSMIKRLMAYDANNDGKLSADELKDERLQVLFERVDADKDTVLEKSELTAYFSKELEALRNTQGGGPGGPGPGAGPGGGGPGDQGGPGRGGPPQPGQILSSGLQQELRLTDAQRKQIADLQREVDARLEKILSPEQQRALRELRERGPRGGGPGNAGGPGNGPPPRRPGQ